MIQTNKIRNDITKVGSIIREFYEQVYANKLDNLDEMD